MPHTERFSNGPSNGHPEPAAAVDANRGHPGLAGGNRRLDWCGDNTNYRAEPRGIIAAIAVATALPR
jgi:hypothetical protein